MGNVDLPTLLRENTYPGRGVAMGLTPDGTRLLIAYFIMGRSENSRNRVFVIEGDDMRTKAFDDSKLSDPSLIIYYPVRTIGNQIIVTNGDQTDTIYEHIQKGGTFEGALHTREFEPDAPNFTSRISGIAEIKDGLLRYKLSILKSAYGSPESCLRYYFDFGTAVAGYGHIIHTYEKDGNPLPSFSGEPRHFSTLDSAQEFSEQLWEALNSENKVSLYVRTVNLETGATEIILKNIHQ